MVCVCERELPNKLPGEARIKFFRRASDNWLNLPDSTLQLDTTFGVGVYFSNLDACVKSICP